jgi:hypothetical protein
MISTLTGRGGVRFGFPDAVPNLLDLGGLSIAFRRVLGTEALAGDHRRVLGAGDPTARRCVAHIKPHPPSPQIRTPIYRQDNEPPAGLEAAPEPATGRT